ncbi:sarcosine oxidase subunit gamma [Aliiruegeria haliotis]|uniref:Sarcosine oxidase subunit gamma n=1 Tax=Aliiruegeria haliotis TaxID=1280846 RepID=A0A2T0RVP3_9RHOB|nr:sarcosine oxidase subunit gamma family protein [Aliiruegeria haliotis]PRY25234.1 sarcosine oxidase subunit gamma [Aliiruegeria haliotis]
MSDAMTALNGASMQGPVAAVREAALQGMVLLRGDLADETLAAVVKDLTGCDLPGQREMVQAGNTAVAWMSPDELLLLVPYEEAGTTVASLSQALEGVYHLAVDVSDARALFRISGEGAREVLARLCPVDLSPAAFGPGEMRRSRLAQVPAAFWIDETGTISLVCFRSVAGYAFGALSAAAESGPVNFL